MKEIPNAPGAKGVSLIELVIVTAMISIIAVFVVPAYSNYRTRAHRLNGESCLLELVRHQDSYFARHNQYATDLKALGYEASSAAGCAATDRYRLTLAPADSGQCPPTHCYRASAIAQGDQKEDGALHLRYDASQADPDRRMKRERGVPRSDRPWD